MLLKYVLIIVLLSCKNHLCFFSTLSVVRWGFWREVQQLNTAWELLRKCVSGRESKRTFSCRLEKFLPLLRQHWNTLLLCQSLLVTLTSCIPSCCCSPRYYFFPLLFPPSHTPIPLLCVTSPPPRPDSSRLACPGPGVAICSSQVLFTYGLNLQECTWALSW